MSSDDELSGSDHEDQEDGFYDALGSKEKFRDADAEGDDEGDAEGDDDQEDEGDDAEGDIDIATPMPHRSSLPPTLSLGSLTLSPSTTGSGYPGYSQPAVTAPSYPGYSQPRVTTPAITSSTTTPSYPGYSQPAATTPSYPGYSQPAATTPSYPGYSQPAATTPSYPGYSQPPATISSMTISGYPGYSQPHTTTPSYPAYSQPPATTPHTTTPSYPAYSQPPATTPHTTTPSYPAYSQPPATTPHTTTPSYPGYSQSPSYPGYSQPPTAAPSSISGGYTSTSSPMYPSTTPISLAGITLGRPYGSVPSSQSSYLYPPSKQVESEKKLTPEMILILSSEDERTKYMKSIKRGYEIAKDDVKAIVGELELSYTLVDGKEKYVNESIPYPFMVESGGDNQYISLVHHIKEALVTFVPKYKTLQQDTIFAAAKIIANKIKYDVRYSEDIERLIASDIALLTLYLPPPGPAPPRLVYPSSAPRRPIAFPSSNGSLPTTTPTSLPDGYLVLHSNNGDVPITSLGSAYISLVMIGDSYIPGAIVLGMRLRVVGSKHPYIIMVTDDVSENGKRVLSLYCTYLIQIPYIAHPTKKLKTAKQREMYDAWMDKSFTPYRCFGLPIKKVIYLHSDMYPLQNIDHLFDMKSPAGCFSYPLPGGKGKDPYLDWYKSTVDAKAMEIPMGANIPHGLVRDALKLPSFTVWSAVIVIEPSQRLMETLLSLIKEKPVYGEEFETVLSAPDEISLADVTSRLNMDWSHIHQKYLLIPRKAEWINRNTIDGKSGPIMYHYLGTNVWELGKDEWPDIKEWWSTADAMVEASPFLAPLFGGPHASTIGDQIYTQYRLSIDIRNHMKSFATDTKQKAEIDNIVERWIIALANDTLNAGLGNGAPVVESDSLVKPSLGNWSMIFSITTIDHPVNNKMIAELTEKKIENGRVIVEQVLQMVNGRLRRYPSITLQKPVVTATKIAYGSRFSITIGSKDGDAVTPERVAVLMKMGGPENLVNLMMAYSTIISGGQQYGLPMEHFRALYDFGVRTEAYASPINSRFIGLGYPDTVYHSLIFPVDSIYGSRGPFSASKLIDTPGSKQVNPPFIENELLQAATKVVAELSNAPKEMKVFFLGPEWKDISYSKILDSHPYSHRIILKHGEFLYENASGKKFQPGKTSVSYWYLSAMPFVDGEKEAAEKVMRTGIR